MSSRLPIARLTSMRCRPQFASTFGADADVADDVVDARIGGVAVDGHLEIAATRSRSTRTSPSAGPGTLTHGVSIGCSGVTHGFGWRRCR